MMHGLAGSGAATVVQPDSSNPDIIKLSDAGLLMSGALERTGVDLHLYGHDGQHLVVPGYFANAHPPALVAPNGVRMNADTVALLASQHAEARAGNTADDATHHPGPNAIGHVDKIVGDVTVQRNGVTVTLHVGDAIYKNDVIQTGSSSSLAISLADGTALNLVANTRVVLNEYSFDINSNSNHALFTVEDGAFAFLAGKIARGDLKIATPVGTLSLHEGTSGWAHELSAKEIAAISGKLGQVTFSFAVLNSADSHGDYELVVNGTIIGNISDPNVIWYLDQDGNLISMPLDHSQEFAEGLPRDFLAWLETSDATTRSLGVRGSGSPIDPSTFPQAVNLNQLGPTFDFNVGDVNAPLAVNLLHNDLPVLVVHSTVFIWNGFGNWDLNPGNWNQGFAPKSPIDTVFIQSGKASYTANYSIGSLAVLSGATLNISSGTLTVSALTNLGLIEINSSGIDPVLIINGQISLTGGGSIEMLGPTGSNFILGVSGSGAALTNVDNLIEGSGKIGQGDGQLTFVNEATVDATPLLPGDNGLLILNTGNTLQNLGVIEATLAGELLIDDRFFNFGTVRALGAGSSVVIDNGPDGNAGLIEAISGGRLIIEDSTIINSSTDGQGRTVDGLVFSGAGSEILLQNATILGGFVSVEAGGEIETISGTTNRIDTSNGTRNVTQPTIVNAGNILINDNSSLVLASPFDIENSGTIELASTGKETLLAFNRPSAVLAGGGAVILDGGTPSQDIIDGLPGAGFAMVSLENRDNTISGAGSIGQGDGALAFQNDVRGIVDADLSRQTLEIATGRNGIVNAGLFEAANGGELHIESDLDNSGKVIAHTASEVLIEADVSNEDDGRIIARGQGALIEVEGSRGDRVSLDNSGHVAARREGTVSFEFTEITNEDGGRIVAAGRHSQVNIEHSSVDNNGAIVAHRHGSVAFEHDRVTNESDGLIHATGRGSEVRFDNSRIKNLGEISAERRADVVFHNSAIENARGGSIDADGRRSRVTFDHDLIGNSGLIEAGHHGKVVFERSLIDNASHGVIEAGGSGSKIAFDRDGVRNSGRIVAEHQGRVRFESSLVDNTRNGAIAADGSGSKLEFDRDIVRNAGRIEAEHHGKVSFEGSLIDNTRHGVIKANGSGSKIEFDHDGLRNAGRIGAEHRGRVVFESSLIGNDRNGMIEAEGWGSKVEFERDLIANLGWIGAARGGSLGIEDSGVRNGLRGEIEAHGGGSEVSFKRDLIDSSGRIAADRGGDIDVDRSRIENDFAGIIEADGRTSGISVDHSGIENRGLIRASLGGSIDIEHSSIRNKHVGEIDAVGRHSEIDFEHDHVRNSGLLEAEQQGEAVFRNSEIDNRRHGKIEANGSGSTVGFNRDQVDNFGRIKARNGGEVTFTRSDLDNDGVIMASHGGRIDFEHSDVDNTNGLIAAKGGGSTVDFDISSVFGGELTTASGGLMHVANGTSTFQDLTITAGSKVDVDDGATLKLTGTIAELGTISIKGQGELDLVSTTVDGGNTGLIKDHGVIDVFNADTLENLTVAGGDMVVESGAKLHIEKTVRLDSVNVANNGGTVIIDANGPATLIVDDGTTIIGGDLLVRSKGTLDVEHGTNASGPSGAVLHGVNVTDNNVIDIGKSATGAVLTLDDGTTISGSGGLMIESGSTLDVEKGRGSGNHGATLDGVIVTNAGTVDLGKNATLSIGDTVKLGAGGTISMASGSAMADNGLDATLDNIDNIISGQGTIGGNHLILKNENSGVIDANGSGHTLVVDAAVIANKGKLKATGGATIDIKSNVNNHGGSIEAHGSGSTVKLEAITVTDGKIVIDAGNTLEIENGATTLIGVDVENSGNLQIDDANITAKLVLGSGSSVDGHVIIGASGELDVNGGTFLDPTTIDDSGILKIDAPLTLNGDVAINVLSGGTVVETGPLTIGHNHSATLSGGHFGEIDIGNHATLTLANADAMIVDFKGADGTLVLKTPSSFTGTIKHLSEGDVIDLGGVAVTSVVLNGNALMVNGAATSFAVSGDLPAGDAFALRSDGHGGTDIKVVKPLVTVSTSGISGIEGSAIPISFSDTLNAGASLTSVSISGIPAGATLSNDFGTLTFTGDTITLDPSLLAGLKITPANDTDFTLSFLVTATDSDHYQYSVTTTEAVTVSPLAPTVSWANGNQVENADGSTVAIPLTVAVGQEPGHSAHNSVASVVISGIQAGAVLSDGSHGFAADASHPFKDISGWSYNSTADGGIENGAVDSTVTEAGVEGTITVADDGAIGKLAISVKAEGANYIGEFSVHPGATADGTASIGFNFDLGHGASTLAGGGHAVTQAYEVSVSEGNTTVLHQTVSVSVGSSGADNFVFSPGIGADTIANFDAQHDTIDLSHFESIRSVQQLASLVTANAHGDAVIDLGNHDSITIGGLNPAHLQQAMQSAVHLH